MLQTLRFVWSIASRRGNLPHAKHALGGVGVVDTSTEVYGPITPPQPPPSPPSRPSRHPRRHAVSRTAPYIHRKIVTIPGSLSLPFGGVKQTSRSIVPSFLPPQLSVLTRVSQMHEALSSIVDACQSSGGGDGGGDGDGDGGRNSSSSSPPADSQREGSRQHRHQNGGGGGGRGDADGGVDEGAWEPAAAAAAVVTAEEGAVIVERSKSCLRVSWSCVSASGCMHGDELVHL